MNKRDAQKLVRGGQITLGDLRKALGNVAPLSWERSTVNPQFTKEQALDIFRKSIAADARPDGTKMNTSIRDEMIAVNIVRESGFYAILEGRSA